MKNILVFIFALIAVLCMTSCSDRGDEYGYVIKDGMQFTKLRPVRQVRLQYQISQAVNGTISTD